MTGINLPLEGRPVRYELTGRPVPFTKREAANFSRVAFAAAHVVADPLADNDPWLAPAIDWERTLAFRHRLWDLGLGVAEAMDTAQRGMGLGWPEARELVRRALAEARGRPGALIACGAGTDHLAPGPDVSIDDILEAYESQIETIEAENGRIILMASRALAAAAKGPDDYIRVYDRILSQVKEPVIIHWLGEMFDPALEGYWGNADHLEAMKTCLAVIEAHAAKVDGIKISLLSKEKEIAMRRLLPEGVRMYTGDDFNYAELIAGDEEGHSDALLGIFDAIAPVASAALHALGEGRNGEFFELLEPTVLLSRHIFKAPTRFYKTGVVFLAYLNGLQDHFVMIGGQQSARSLTHFAELFRLADKAGALTDPDLATARMRRVLAVHGVD
ncbi:dihydrodipicolinate synthase family protein [Sinorhizobium numidicum]|uniref:Dihydrodipicolinate synthase family protein n=1 Tax=Sinorhizobium numidicum TaxID=680248 RepID=A0ABY8CSG2_9HYPH|nr:dihydrodipicolinate synthase family protein [Sinorhizobium numidicum]WEX75537.1 dihydrodipicolinate synthase family protein [Sinorhizobium numidicum]WEX81534.1 dihydrodipicolinate synthase family protein [Sinorhizobium numidicum]